MIPLIQNFNTIVLANGAFPHHPTLLNLLQHAERIICCDGATENLLAFGREPDFIVGDLDSISLALKERFATILHHNPDQETNDLTKSIRFCVNNNWKKISILGATGKREDHTLGNLSLLVDYAAIADVQLLTDYGSFVPQRETCVYESYPGQQISIFSITPDTLFTFQNLAYEVKNRKLTSWWQGTLNEAVSEQFTIEITHGKVLVFREL
ncbi:MAG: thiamine diphosphokinase [Candidatus Symbiothrix sp.]|jgi:thiamine pyrophosphokinase|nr:thiamine diphosphokinase [Candidatus Symbiothrix sp.]